MKPFEHTKHKEMWKRMRDKWHKDVSGDKVQRNTAVAVMKRDILLEIDVEPYPTGLCYACEYAYRSSDCYNCYSYNCEDCRLYTHCKKCPLEGMGRCRTNDSFWGKLKAAKNKKEWVKACNAIKNAKVKEGVECV